MLRKFHELIHFTRIAGDAGSHLSLALCDWQPVRLLETDLVLLDRKITCVQSAMRDRDGA